MQGNGPMIPGTLPFRPGIRGPAPRIPGPIPGVRGPAARGPGAMRGPLMPGPGAVRGPLMPGPGAMRGPLMPGPGAMRGPLMPGPGSGRGPLMQGPGSVRGPLMQGPGSVRGPLMQGPGAMRGPLMQGPGAMRGPIDSGSRGDEGPIDSGARVGEGPIDSRARVGEGPIDSGSWVSEGPIDSGSWVSEGPIDSGSWVSEGPISSGSWVSEGPIDTGARGSEGPINAGARGDEWSSDAGARGGEGSYDARPRVGEGPLAAGARISEGPLDAGARGSGKSTDARPRSSQEPIDAGPRDSEGPGVAGAKTNQRPRDVGTRTSPGNSGAGGHERPLGSRTSPGEKHEPSRCRAHERADTPRPNAQSQRTTPSSGTEGPSDAQRHGDEDTTAYGSSSNREPHPSGPRPGQKHAAVEGQLGPGTSDGDETRDSVEGPSYSRGADSFKKPILPARSGGHEKAVEPRDKPASSSSRSPSSLGTRVAHREAPADASHRLPSDAYRAAPSIPYREPSWSGRPQALYSLEMLKGGNIVSTKSLNEDDWMVFGRLPSCHVSLEHPSVSRYHAVLQYRQSPGPEPGQEPGFYMYDLDSTHGTFLNKQRISPKTYCRFRVGHVVKFGGSTRLFILQGPDDDQDEESELTVTQLKEARRQKEMLQRKMLGDDSDDDDDLEEEKKSGNEPESSGQDAGCMWGMGDDAMEEENDENPIALEFQEEKEDLYTKDPKKALKGFFDREGEELEYEYEERGLSMWLCRVRLPADDSSGKQLVAEIIHTGKKKDAAKVCALEACRMLDMRGLFRQEAVSRKRKSKQWEAEDFYDSDDDTFLDRTGLVEKKRLNRMKKAGKIEEKVETYDSLIAKLNLVEKELADVAAKLRSSQPGEAHSSEQDDSLDAFMTEIKSGVSLDAVTRKKLHLQTFELKKEQHRLKGLIKIAQPTKLPDLIPLAPESQPKKRSLPMFGAMKGGSKFKLKTGTVGKLPPKRADLPVSLFTMKDDNEPEEDDDENMAGDCRKKSQALQDPEKEQTEHQDIEMSSSQDPPGHLQPLPGADSEETCIKGPKGECRVPAPGDPPEIKAGRSTESNKAEKEPNVVKPKKVLGPSRPPSTATSTRYPEDDPDYSVWTPPAGQTGDGRTHLNEKYGY
uniref:Solute carrier family 4 member 1 adaptor protein n=1 Tax=Leptobrachium leishanense TaxID=445787 RepID=A0A8C5MQT4_9ANUR